MEKTTKEKLIIAILKFQKVNARLLSGSDVRMNEVVAMIIIEADCSGGEKTKLISVIGETLCITQSAVSQMLGSLEKKGYICRHINQKDKRKFLFALTEKGKQIAQRMRKETDRIFETIVSRFGKDKTLLLIQMLNEFAEVSELVQNDKTQRECTN